ncbi:MAG: cell division protein FtsA [Synergistaceae bacterium]|nr:cell division protein FtsA [Synergistaceae bacterium]
MPVKSDSLLVGLSMGTTKTIMIVAKRDRNYPDSIHVIGFGDAASRGISKGIIVSVPEAQQSVMEALKKAQGMTGINPKELSNVMVAFNAWDVRSESTHGMITLGGRDSKSDAVARDDLDRVIERARDESELKINMYPLHLIPTSYELDGRPVDEPLSMNGTRLDMWLQTVAVPMTYVQTVKACVRKAGLEVKGLILKPLASSLGAVYEEEKRAGCISICIGGGTTGIVLFRGGRAFRVLSIPIGGDHIKSDLATVLHLPLGEADFLKRQLFNPNTNLDELRNNGIDVDLATQIVLARIEELFSEHIRTALAECTPQHFPMGVILSGGVSETPGIEYMLADILQLPVRKVEKPVYPLSYGLDNAAYVSAAGILKYCVDVERDPYLFMESENRNRSSRPSQAGTSGNYDSGSDSGTGSGSYEDFGGNDDDNVKNTRPSKSRDKAVVRESDFYGDDNVNHDNDDYDDDDYYDDEEDDEPRESVREKLGRFLDNLKKIF